MTALPSFSLMSSQLGKPWKILKKIDCDLFSRLDASSKLKDTNSSMAWMHATRSYFWSLRIASLISNATLTWQNGPNVKLLRVSSQHSARIPSAEQLTNESNDRIKATRQMLSAGPA